MSKCTKKGSGRNMQKVMYFFWANSQISWMRYMTLYSFRKLNPDWKIILYLCRPNKAKIKTWIDAPTQDFHNFEGRDYFQEVHQLDITILRWELENNVGMDVNKIGPSHKSNFFKWQILSRCSGFYCDLDVLFVKPFHSLYEQCKDSDVLIAHHNYWSIGLLGSSGDNQFYRDLYKNAFQRYTPKQYQSAGVLSIHSWCAKLEEDSKPYTNFITVKKYYPNIRFFNLDMVYIYPWRYNQNQIKHVFSPRRKHTVLPERCIGIHWYAGTKISQKYNNLMNGSNFTKFNNTYSHFAQELLNECKG